MDRREVLLGAAGATTLLLGGGGSLPLEAASNATQAGRGQSFDLGWRFRRGEGVGFESRELDDRDWRAVDIPHDWSIEDLTSEKVDTSLAIVGPFDRDALGGIATGFTVGGEGWYRKNFHLDKAARGRVELLFEGIYMNSDVWLNGHHLGAHPEGYTPSSYDLTPYLAADGNNVLAVRVRNLGKNSRWYAGSGIYRHVWLDVLPERARISRWGVGVLTRRVVDGRADIEIVTRLEEPEAGLTLVSRVKDEIGRVVAEVSARTADEVKQTISIESAKLWSPDSPNLYSLESELRRNEVVIDRTSQTFGVRIVAFDAQRGMTINGVPTKLRGGCIHHDNGLLGAASFDAAEERKVRLLKARGFNAVRPSHNLFSRSFLDACDRLGMLVVAETFDVWSEPKLPDDYSVHFATHWRRDLASIVLSTRNHPSIIMWSIGNEIPGRNTRSGIETQWRLANEVHKLDPTRPVTAAIHGFAGRVVKPSIKTARVGSAGEPDRSSTVFLDVVGYNYKLDDYEDDHRLFPKQVMYGSESFPKDVAAIWELTEQRPWLIGDFVWTAMDYLGEAGIGGSVVTAKAAAGNPMAIAGKWPWVNAFCGDIDLLGHPKPQSLARDVVWGMSPLELAVQRPVPENFVEEMRVWGWSDELCSWSWPGSEGKALNVRVYTSADRVELRLNGRVLESKPLTAADRKKVEFVVKYQPGRLEAVAFRAGAVVARKQLQTSGAPAAIKLRPETTKGGASRSDVSYVGIEIVDAEGRIVPDATNRVQLDISGPAELVAFGTASGQVIGSFRSTVSPTWHGRAQAILRGTGKAGRVLIQARGDGLEIGQVALQLA